MQPTVPPRRSLSNLWGMSSAIPCLDVGFWAPVPHPASSPMPPSFQGADIGAKSDFPVRKRSVRLRLWEEENVPDRQLLLEARLRQLQELRQATVVKTTEVEREMQDLNQQVAKEEATRGSGSQPVAGCVAEVLGDGTFLHLFEGSGSDLARIGCGTLQDLLSRVQEVQGTSSHEDSKEDEEGEPPLPRPHNDSLAKLRALRDMNPNIAELPTVYLDYAEGLAQIQHSVDPACQSEMLADVTSCLSVLETVLKLPTADDFSPLLGEDEEYKVQEAKLCSQIAMAEHTLQKAGELRTGMKCDDERRQRAKQYLTDLAGKVSTMEEGIKKRKTQRTSSFNAETAKTESQVTHLQRKRDACCAKIAEYRKEIESLQEAVLSMTREVEKKELQLQRRRDVEASVSAAVEKVEALLQCRWSECQAGLRLLETTADTSSNLRQVSAELLQQRDSDLQKVLASRQKALTSAAAAHWETSLQRRRAAVTQVRAAQRLLGQEVASVRLQRKSGAATSLLQLQEQLVQQRGVMLTERKKQQQEVEEELENVSNMIDRMQLLHNEDDDFREGYKQELSCAAASEQLQQLHDQLCLVCDFKHGTSELLPDSELLNELLEMVDGLYYRGAFSDLKRALAMQPDTRSAMLILLPVLSETAKALESTQHSEHRPVAGLLAAVRDKLTSLLQDTSQCN